VGFSDIRGVFLLYDFLIDCQGGNRTKRMGSGEIKLISAYGSRIYLFLTFLVMAHWENQGRKFQVPLYSSNHTKSPYWRRVPAVHIPNCRYWSETIGTRYPSSSAFISFYFVGSTNDTVLVCLSYVWICDELTNLLHCHYHQIAQIPLPLFNSSPVTEDW